MNNSIYSLHKDYINVSYLFFSSGVGPIQLLALYHQLTYKGLISYKYLKELHNLAIYMRCVSGVAFTHPFTPLIMPLPFTPRQMVISLLMASQKPLNKAREIFFQAVLLTMKKWQENIYTQKWTKFRYVCIYFCIFMCWEDLIGP